jgi:hypothetical protein
MSWKASNPSRYIGDVIGNGHCVRYVQSVAEMPHTSEWRRGVKVRGSNIEPGTVIATFGEDGRYENRTDGASHAAIFIAELADGIRVSDQWRGHPVAERTIWFRNGDGKKVNDGDQFYVVEA